MHRPLRPEMGVYSEALFIPILSNLRVFGSHFSPFLSRIFNAGVCQIWLPFCETQTQRALQWNIGYSSTQSPVKFALGLWTNLLRQLFSPLSSPPRHARRHCEVVFVELIPRHTQSFLLVLQPQEFRFVVRVLVCHVSQPTLTLLRLRKRLVTEVVIRRVLRVSGGAFREIRLIVLFEHSFLGTLRTRVFFKRGIQL